MIDDPAEAIHPEDPDDDWSAGVPPSGVRVRRLTAALVVLVAIAGGFWGGAVAEQHHGSATTTSAALASRLAALRSGRAGGSGFGAGGGSGLGVGGAAVGAPATLGLVTEVQGGTVYVTDAAGKLVKVTVGPSTTVTMTARGTAVALAVGDSVRVQGTTSSDGSVVATSVTAVGSAGG